MNTASWPAKARRFFESSWIAYSSLLAYQLWRVGAIWLYKDLTVGDTSSYFYGAAEWHLRGTVNFAWSPLYTAFYGSILTYAGDAYLATILHRLLIVCSVTLLILVLMRAVCTPTLAWLAAAWWASLPINFNTLYEIHLFSVLPALIALLFVAVMPREWGRPLALSSLLVGMTLVRNEYVVPFVVFTVYLAIAETDAFRHRAGPRFLTVRTLTRYGCALAVAVLLIVGFHSRSRYKYSEIWSIYEGKHIANICQVYAVGYQQRHPEYLDSPWTNCEPLMLRTFGARLPSLKQAFWANPRAVLEHFAWNALLAPAGLEVLLFNATGFQVNPDFPDVVHNPKAHILFGAAIVLWLAGIWAIVRHWRDSWSAWFSRHRDLVVVAAALTVMSTMALLVERPRPSYLFSLEACLLLMSLICSAALVRISSRLDGILRYGWVGAILLFIAVPPYFSSSRHLPQRTVYTTYKRLAAHSDVFQGDRPVILLSSVFPFELCSYIVGDNPGACKPLFYSELRQSSAPGTSAGQLLAASNASVVYLDDSALRDDYFRSVLRSPESQGWSLRGAGERPGDRWVLLKKLTGSSSVTRSPCLGAVPAKMPLHINAGGPGVSHQGAGAWLADTGYTGGGVYSTTAKILGTNTPHIYQTNRWGAFSYSFDVPNGSRTVTLRFAELAPVSRGQRLFDVFVDGARVLQDFDVVAAAGGQNIAVDRSFTFNVEDQHLKLEFVPKKANAFVSAISIR